MNTYKCRFEVWGYRHAVLVLVRCNSREEAYRTAWAYADKAFGPQFNRMAGVWLEDRAEAA